MKILGISCSPRKNGNTVAMLEKVLAGAKADGADIELYSVAGKNIQPCDGCWGCMKSGECHIKDDMQELYDKIAEADGRTRRCPEGLCFLHDDEPDAAGGACIGLSHEPRRPGEDAQVLGGFE